jgi:protein-tyrosine phosphatase
LALRSFGAIFLFCRVVFAFPDSFFLSLPFNSFLSLFVEKERTSPLLFWFFQFFLTPSQKTEKRRNGRGPPRRVDALCSALMALPPQPQDHAPASLSPSGLFALLGRLNAFQVNPMLLVGVRRHEKSEHPLSDCACRVGTAGAQFVGARSPLKCRVVCFPADEYSVAVQKVKEIHAALLSAAPAAHFFRVVVACEAGDPAIAVRIAELLRAEDVVPEATRLLALDAPLQEFCATPPYSLVCDVYDADTPLAVLGTGDESFVESLAKHRADSLPSEILPGFLYHGTPSYVTDAGWQALRETLHVSAILNATRTEHHLVLPSARVQEGTAAANSCPDDAISVLFIPCDDSPDENLFQHFDRACDFLQRCRAEKRKVLVHCEEGVSRSTTFICAFLIRDRKLTAKAALRHIKARRYLAFPNAGFLRQLIRFEIAEGVSEKPSITVNSRPPPDGKLREPSLAALGLLEPWADGDCPEEQWAW